jgi:group II intron reverse transcriptase/maturase
MRQMPEPQGKAMYVATEVDKAWLLNEQRKLYARSQQNLDYVFDKLWGLVTDARNLRIAFGRIARNRGRRTAGVDGVTVGKILAAGTVDTYVAGIRSELRSRSFRPMPVRRVLIPKPEQRGKFRPLGIPTVKDRIVQAAVKNILEPIFEADFFPTSFGFRPGRGAHGALEALRKFLQPRKHRNDPGDQRFAYPWAIEGDIRACFDNISHHGLMQRVRRRVLDAKVNRLVVAFLKADILAERSIVRNEVGTPQGGVLSPLLANIALSVIEERYERHVWPRRTPTLETDPERVAARALSNRNRDRYAGLERGRPILVPIRYADDFIVLVGVPYGPEASDRACAIAHEEKAALAQLLKASLNVELADAKTRVTPVTSPMRFLGHHVRVHRHPKWGWGSKTVIPKDRSKRLRALIRVHFGVAHHETLKNRLAALNPTLRGWSNFYRHAWGAKSVFYAIDSYVWHRVRSWLRKKHARIGRRQLIARYGRRKPGKRMVIWHDAGTFAFETGRQKVERFKHGWMKKPDFALSSTESPVRNESRTPGSAGGARKPVDASRRRRRAPT